MNGTKKFHKANGPAFNVGEVWQGISAAYEVEIVGVSKFGKEKFDYEVSYMDERGNLWKKDAWNFQVRFQHIADIAIS
jgi:hypothetical protein